MPAVRGHISIADHEGQKTNFKEVFLAGKYFVLSCFDAPALLASVTHDGPVNISSINFCGFSGFHFFVNKLP